MNKKITYVSLVDDHALLRSGLASLVQSFEGYEVLFEADNGKDFINQLKPQYPPDIILLDITMPEMNGYETAEWIRDNLPESKILVLSMMDNDNAIISMLKKGARGYLLKDSKPAVFRHALDCIRESGYFINELVSNKMLNYVHKGDSPAEQAHISALSNLTERELSFLKLACTEMTHREIAGEMMVSPRTVDGYRDSLFGKLNVSSRVGLVLYAIRNGIYKL